MTAPEWAQLTFFLSRYRVTTKLLQMSLRKSFQYQTIVRNINRCFNEDLKIELHFDTYVDIDNHKHAFFSEGPVTGGGENTVAQSTKVGSGFCTTSFYFFTSSGLRGQGSAGIQFLETALRVWAQSAEPESRD